MKFFQMVTNKIQGTNIGIIKSFAENILNAHLKLVIDPGFKRIAAVG